MVSSAIILAGGLGTRLKNVLNNIPKPMAPIDDKPFLSYLLSFLGRQGIKRVILAVGYKGDYIANFFSKKYLDIDLLYSFEDENSLLGTGGAVLKASKLINDEDFFVLNGDTIFEVNLMEIYRFHKSKNADITIALKPMDNVMRYGAVEIDKEGRIINFIEKGIEKFGLINGGIYLISKNFMHNLNLAERFSFEQDLIQKYFGFYKFYGIKFDSYFIDIGVPEGYEKAKNELPKRY